MAKKKPPNSKGKASLREATIGQLTSNIRNKQTRSEVYSKLKNVKRVSSIVETTDYL